MKTFLRNLFGNAPGFLPAGKQLSAPSRDNPATIEDGSENATRRQLIPVLLRDVLRRSGIPPAWIECQMLLVSSRTRGHGMYVRLVLKHWDHRMLNYTVAFQNALLAEIERFEPKAGEWLHGISWQLEVGNSCPYIELPEKSYWSHSAPAVVIGPATAAYPEHTTAPRVADIARSERTKTVDDNDPTADLERLFAIRDRELDRQAAEGLTPVGYEKTQPSPL